MFSIFCIFVFGIGYQTSLCAWRLYIATDTMPQCKRKIEQWNSKMQMWLVYLLIVQVVSGVCRTQCSTDALGASPVCGGDGRTYSSRCLLQLARCSGHRVKMVHKGRCRGMFMRKTQLFCDQYLSLKPGFHEWCSLETSKPSDAQHSANYTFASTSF